MNWKFMMLAVAVVIVGFGAVAMAEDSEAAAGDVLASGSCGTSLTYEVRSTNADDSRAELTISGSGGMDTWSSASNTPWYAYRSNIVSINLPDGLSTVSSEAFNGFSRITKISIPEGVTSIGNRSFSNCTALREVELPSTLLSLGQYAFNGCTAIQNIVIPKSVTYIGTNIFNNCSNLKSIEMPMVVGEYKLNWLEHLAYTTSKDIQLGPAKYMPQYMSRATLQTITFADDRIPAYALYDQNLDTLTITNASGDDFIGIYTSPTTRATTEDLTVTGTAAYIVRLTDLYGNAELLDGGITTSDVTIGWNTTPQGYATGPVDASPEVLVYPAKLGEESPYSMLFSLIPLFAVLALLLSVVYAFSTYAKREGAL